MRPASVRNTELLLAHGLRGPRELALRAAAAGLFVVDQPQPVEVGELAFEAAFGHRGGIQVFDAQHVAQAGLARGEPGEERGARVAQVQVARWRGRKPARAAVKRRACGQRWDHPATSASRRSRYRRSGRLAVRSMASR